MKRLPAIAVLICVFLSGCTVRFSDASVDEAPQSVTSSRFEVTEADSVVDLDVYPENCRGMLVGKFDRYQYSRLSDEQKRIYILLDNAIYNMTTGYIMLGESRAEDVTRAYYALRSDRPEYFWIPSSYSYFYSGSSMSVRFADKESDWLCSADERVEYEAVIRRYIEKFIADRDMTSGEYERELSAHDAVAAAVSYDFAAAKNIENNMISGTVVGAVVNGKAVCTGYVKAMQMLCFAAGIECITVTGSTNEPHMWNCVRIDGKWYHVDVTADDSSDNGYHSFFNVTTEYIGIGCRIDADIRDLTEEEAKGLCFNVDLPDCTSLDANYFHVNSLYITNVSQARATLISEVCEAVRSGRNRVELCFDPSIGFVAGETSYSKFFDVEEALVAANDELPAEKRIKKYSVVSLDRSTSITVTWD